MKTQCPFCKKVFKAPDSYKGRLVRCPGCKERFLVSEYIKPVAQSKTSPKPTRPPKPNLFVRAWSHSPQPFRVAFLATIGVVSALFLTLHIYNLPGSLLDESHDKHKKAVQSYPNEIISKNTATYDTNLNAENFYAIVVLSQYAHALDSMRHLRGSICDRVLEDASLVKPASSILACLRDELNKSALGLSSHTMPDDPTITAPTIPQIQHAYIKAYKSEIAAVEALIKVTKGQINDSRSVAAAIERSNDDLSNASFTLVTTIFKIDPGVADAVQKQHASNI